MLSSLPVSHSLLTIIALFSFSAVAYSQEMKFSSSTLKEIAQDEFDKHTYKLRINTLGSSHPLSLLQLITRSKGNCTIQVYYSGTEDTLKGKTDSLILNGSSYISQPVTLLQGANYFWIHSDEKVQVKSFKLGRPEYKLVWADEFETDTIRKSNWQFEKGFVRNNELQWYQEENAGCSGGILTIEARKEQKINPLYTTGASDWRRKRDSIRITSSSMLTSGKQSWLYGRFEMRGRIDTVSGYWPAWWTLGVSKRWPANGEIDIMEFYRGKILANIAVGTNVPSKALWYSETKTVNSFADPHWRDKFHTWRMDWDEEGISLYVDDLLLNHRSQSLLYNRDGSGFYPFKQNHYMLLNLAIGGDNGGSVEHTSFPVKYEVDYVRVYQKITGKYNSIRTYKPTWE